MHLVKLSSTYLTTVNVDKCINSRKTFQLKGVCYEFDVLFAFLEGCVTAFMEENVSRE